MFFCFSKVFQFFLCISFFLISYIVSSHSPRLNMPQFNDQHNGIPNV